MNLKYISLVVAFCILSLTACTQKKETADKPLISQSRLDDIVAEHPKFSGSVVVAQDGKIIAGVHIGQADQELAILNDAKTLHSIASVGKMFTSVAIGQLVEAGLLVLGLIARDRGVDDDLASGGLVALWDARLEPRPLVLADGLALA